MIIKGFSHAQANPIYHNGQVILVKKENKLKKGEKFDLDFK